MRKYIKFIVLLAVAVLIFWYFGRNLDWAEVSAAVRRADPYYLVLAFLGICLGYFLRAVRWRVLLAPITESRIRDLFATTTVGFAAILLVGRAGEIVRPMWLPMRDRRIRPSAALVTIFVERMFDLASLLAFFSISLIWFKPPAGHEAEFETVKFAGNIMIGVVIAGFIGMVVYHRFAETFIRLASRVVGRSFVPGRIQEMILSLMKNLANALDILKSPREILLVTFWTSALWLSIAIPTWLILLAFGLEMTFLHSTFVMGVASLGSLIPTPGGAAGAFHAATAGSLIILGVEKETAAAVSIVTHLIYFVPALVFGLYYLFHGDISVEKFRSLLSSENAEREIETDSPDFVRETS
ncbi:MAG: lysylphosphatidylglycerol synthase transmembrane domain-containing protein [Pyrinomonadaceae bacterium]